MVLFQIRCSICFCKIHKLRRFPQQRVALDKSNACQHAYAGQGCTIASSTQGALEFRREQWCQKQTSPADEGGSPRFEPRQSQHPPNRWTDVHSFKTFIFLVTGKLKLDLTRCTRSMRRYFQRKIILDQLHAKRPIFLGVEEISWSGGILRVIRTDQE